MRKHMSGDKSMVAGHGKQLKQRKTFTLSPESIALLEELSAQRGSGERESVSAVLDSMLSAIGEERRRIAMERSTDEYYGGRSTEEEEEEKSWARFALSQFPVREEPPGGAR